MKAKTITAKIRDAVQVCLMVEGDEVKRYKNIELPGEIKELEIRDFGFQITQDGKIDFNLHFEQGVLPKEFPTARAKVTRAEKAAMKVQLPEVIAESAPEPEAAQVTEEPAPEDGKATDAPAADKKAKPARKSRFSKIA